MKVLLLHGSIEYFRLEKTFVVPLVQLPHQSGSCFETRLGPGAQDGHFTASLGNFSHSSV